MMQHLYKTLPSVDACLTALETFNATAPRGLIKELVVAFLDERRKEIQTGRITDPKVLQLERMQDALLRFVRRGLRPHFQRVLNATGVVLHTNMGRAVLSEDAIAAVNEACRGYSNLELELSTGKRGSRYSHVESLLCKLSGAEAALVVNNNAAAVFLTLDALCRGHEVVVARGQLVEIGGSFRIPDVMSRSGAVLREVGCTNRVHKTDYEQAITDSTAALMRVHTSNYRVIGFHSDVSVKALSELAHEHNILCIEDLGSGSLLDLAAVGLPGEPTVQAVVAGGADVVMFSGDKVLGGPQAGIIVGKRAVLEKIKQHPLNRALRIDKMTLAALEATLRLYLDESKARQQIPTLRMIFESPESIHKRAMRLAARLRKRLGTYARIQVVEGAAQVGGGSFPEHDLRGSVIRFSPLVCSVETLRQRLLKTDPPLIGRVEDNALCLDPRTLSATDASAVVDALSQALGCF